MQPLPPLGEHMLQLRLSVVEALLRKKHIPALRRETHTCPRLVKQPCAHVGLRYRLGQGQGRTGALARRLLLAWQILWRLPWQLPELPRRLEWRSRPMWGPSAVSTLPGTQCLL